MARNEIIELAVKAGLGEAASFKLSGEKLTNTKDGLQYLAKTGSNILQMKGEAEGLKRMYATAPGLVPKLHVIEELDGGKRAAFISDYLDLGGTSNTVMMRLAERMAQEMHHPDHQAADVQGFGFPMPTHCGPTEQDNTWTQDWMTFWRDRRLGHLLEQIEKKKGGSAHHIVELGRRVQEKVVPALLEVFQPKPKPVLLHGDLWSGNVASGSDGEPVLFDSSCYYGHNEAEFGISHMFSTFPPSFYEKYHTILPKSQPHYDERMKLYELYHHLNHYLLFGSGYGRGAQAIMQSLLAWHGSQ